MNEQTDYLKYRGKCRELSEALAKDNPNLTVARGWYHCPIWGQQAHWWCQCKDGTIIDPTKDQFPSKGDGFYVEYDGRLDCECCGKTVHEDDAYLVEHHVYCSYECYGRDVMG